MRCTFCAKIDFRDHYRRRRLDLLLDEIDGLIAQGARYLYFIDEIFLPQRPLLEALAARDVQFGVQTRIDLWKPEMLDLLGRAGCVSVEAGVESLTAEGRDALAKKCRLTPTSWPALLIRARRTMPFVQANLIEADADDADAIAAWRERLQRAGRMGERSGAAVPVSEFARLSPALGRAGRCMRGSGRTSTTSPASRASATSRSRRRCRCPSSSTTLDRTTAARHAAAHRRRRGRGVVAMSSISREGLQRRGVAVTVATLGPRPSARSNARP